MTDRRFDDVILNRLLVFVFGCVLCQPCSAVDLSNCQKALGMQSGRIPDSAVTASSSYDWISVGPANGRVRTERNGGAWCPRGQISRDVHEWLEVDLQQLKVFTEVETQGRFGSGQGQEYAEGYMLEYQRVDGTSWIRFRDRTGSEVFEGNRNTYTAERRVVNPPIIARRIRFIPYCVHQRTVCMRVELFGCTWKEGLLAYSIPDGHERGTEIIFVDFTYDGRLTDGVLTGGLGLLTDGVEGPSNFRADPGGRRGYGWVGWKTNATGSRPVRMTFEFDGVRNFTSMTIHAFNAFSKDVRVFRRAEVRFSVGGPADGVGGRGRAAGRQQQSPPVVVEFARDSLNESARNVVVPLANRLGRQLDVRLYFDARWILVSEVTFESEVVYGNFSNDDLSSQIFYKEDDQSETNSNLLPVEDSNNSSLAEGVRASRDRVADGVVACVAVTGLMLCAVTATCLARHRCCRRTNKPTGNRHSDSFLRVTSMPPYSILSNDIQTRKLPEVPATTASPRTDFVRRNRLPETTYDTLAPGDLHVDDARIYADCLQPADSPPPLPRPLQSRLLYSITPPPLPGRCRPTLQGCSGNSVYSVPGNLSSTSDDISPVQIQRERLVFIEKLGEGPCGQVSLCEAMMPSSGSETEFDAILVGIKILSEDASLSARADFYHEMNTLLQLRHDNIVRLIGVCTLSEPLVIVTEYLKHGDLRQFLRHCDDTVLGQASLPSYGALINMAMQIASGMNYLSSLNVIHRDLAARNCLVGESYRVKIADFAMSRRLYTEDYYRIDGNALLPLRWMAYESITMGRFSSTSDVYSFGVTLWELMNRCRSTPFQDLDDEAIIENCYAGGHVTLPRPADCPSEMYDLMRQCWNVEEKRRPTFDEVHMFLQRKNRGYSPADDYRRSMMAAGCGVRTVCPAYGWGVPEAGCQPYEADHWITV